MPTAFRKKFYIVLKTLNNKLLFLRHSENSNFPAFFFFYYLDELNHWKPLQIEDYSRTKKTATSLQMEKKMHILGNFSSLFSQLLTEMIFILFTFTFILFSQILKKIKIDLNCNYILFKFHLHFLKKLICKYSVLLKSVF